jgi:uncharacterized protein YunC (DUF1805 family)
MPDAFFPPVVLTFVASTADVTTAIERVVGSYETMGAAVKASTTEVGAASAAMGERVTASTAEISIASDRLVSSNARVAASIGSAAKEWETSYAAMAATTAELSAQMEMANAKAAASAEAMGAKIDAAAKSTTDTTVGRMAAIQKGALLVGAAGLIASGAFVHMAGDFEQSTNKLLTSAGESHDAIGMVRDGLLSMASEVGVSAGNLSLALYKIEPAGYHGAAGLGVLKAAMQGAKAEGADGVRVADALSSALRDYYPHATDAAEVTRLSADVMSKFIGATSTGKMTFDELAGSLNSILPVASAAKISLSDTLGVLASMTVHGISAQQATQNMADAIRHLQGAGQNLSMSKAMATIGVDSVDVAAKLGQRGLAGTMEYLSEKIKNFMPPGSDRVILELGTALSKSTPKVQELGHAVLAGNITMKQFSGELKGMDPLSAKQAQSFATLAARYHQLGTQQLSGAEVMATYSGMLQQVMGDATGLKVALMTTGENVDYTNESIKTITGSTADAAGNVKGWSDIQGTFNQKLSEASAGAQALGISIGQKLLPIASKIMEVFAAGAHWLSEHKWAATTLAVLLGGMLVIGLAAATAAVITFTVALLANPMTWIVLGIMVLIAAIFLLATHWKQVWHALAEVALLVWTRIQIMVIDPAVAAFHGFMDAVHAFADFWVWVWNLISDTAAKVWHWIEANIFHPIGVAVGAISAAMDGTRAAWDAAWHAMGDAIQWVYDHVIKPVVDLIREAVAFAKDPWGHITGSDVSGQLSGGFKFDHHQDGGFVGGPAGAPRLIVAHGGEYVLSQAMLAGRVAPDLAAPSPAMTAATGQRGGGNTTVLVHVAGSIWSEQELLTKIREKTLRYNQRNSSNGLTFGPV